MLDMILASLLVGQCAAKFVCQPKSFVPKAPLAPEALVKELVKFAAYASVAYCDAEARRRNVRSLSPGAMLHADTHADGFQALTYTNGPDREIVVAFRGAYGFEQFIGATFTERASFHDLPGATVTKVGMKATAKIGGGVLASLRELKGQHPDYRVVLTGHSLGGVVATLLAPRVAEELQVAPSSLRVITYNQPRPGNFVFAIHYNRLGFNFTRAVNRYDGASNYPSFDHGWKHVQREVFVDPAKDFRLCGTHAIEDPACSFKKGYVANRNHQYLGDINISSEGCSR